MRTKKKLIKSKKNLATLAHKLNYLCDFLEMTYDINSGGCCYIASCIAHLLELDNINYLVAVTDVECDSFYDINCSQRHYFLILNNVSINRNDYDNYVVFNGVCAKDLLDHYHECDWNDFYNTFKNKFIYKTIVRFYKDFTYGMRK